MFVESDASCEGLGAVLLQVRKEHEDQKDPATAELQPVAYASKTLSGAESRYSNIEREALGILHALEKFRYFVFGRPVTVITDHQPLVNILQKDVATATPRLQRLLLKIHNYNVKIVYKKGSQMYISDYLSRQLPNRKDPEIPGLELSIHAVRRIEEVSEETMKLVEQDLPYCINTEDVIRETSSDPEMQELVKLINLGWPEAQRNCSPATRPYFTYREELGVFNGQVLKGTRIVIPRILREDILGLLHYSHLGEVKTQKLAKDKVFWPGISADIRELVRKCKICSEHQASQKDVELTSHDVVPGPWYKLGADLFFPEGQKAPYLIVVDYFSKFPMIEKLKNQSAEELKKAFGKIIGVFGLPRVLMSDSGTNFKAKAFKDFCKTLGIKQEFSSPQHHSSNGQVENMIKTVKRTLMKARKDKRGPNCVMMHLRQTPNMTTGKSPAELIFSYKPRGFLPEVRNPTDDEVVEKIQQSQRSQKYYHDQHARWSTTEFHVGDPVDVQKCDQGPWAKGVILQKNMDSHQGKSFLVKMAHSGNILIRNVKHLRHSKIPVTFHDQDEAYSRLEQDLHQERLKKLVERYDPDKPRATADLEVGGGDRQSLSRAQDNSISPSPTTPDEPVVPQLTSRKERKRVSADQQLIASNRDSVLESSRRSQRQSQRGNQPRQSQGQSQSCYHQKQSQRQSQSGSEGNAQTSRPRRQCGKPKRYQD